MELLLLIIQKMFSIIKIDDRRGLKIELNLVFVKMVGEIWLFLTFANWLNSLSTFCHTRMINTPTGAWHYKFSFGGLHVTQQLHHQWTSNLKY